MHRRAAWRFVTLERETRLDESAICAAGRVYERWACAPERKASCRGATTRPLGEVEAG
jgi:hypothetical protein